MANVATAISGIAHLEAFDDLAKSRLESGDLSPILMYMIDTAPASALYYLAGQFNVLGFKGWILAQTDADKRSLIKRAIELNRYKGTVWAIKEACRAVGFADAEVKEHVGIDYNGEHNYNGAVNYSGGFWANFRVIIHLNDTTVVDVALVDLARNLILEYKNVRSWLTDISFAVDLADNMRVNESITMFTTISGITTSETF